MKSKLKLWMCCIAMMGFWSETHADEWSQTFTVNAVLVYGTEYFFTNPAFVSWHPSCPNAVYVRIVRSDPASSQLLALVLTAKAMGLQIVAYGNCTESPYYWRTNNIQVF